MVDRFHYIRQFAGEPIDEEALDTLTTMVHKAAFNGTGPPRRDQRASTDSGRRTPKSASSARE